MNGRHIFSQFDAVQFMSMSINIVLSLLSVLYRGEQLVSYFSSQSVEINC